MTSAKSASEGSRFALSAESDDGGGVEVGAGVELGAEPLQLVADLAARCAVRVPSSSIAAAILASPGTPS